jgi:FkbM family methyltransferase
MNNINQRPCGNVGRPDIFEKYKHLYDAPVVRPQPSDYVIDYFKEARGLSFIDVGAYDGLTWSNSLPLEEFYGWTGICVEPNSKPFEKRRAHRKCICLNIALADTEAEMKFLEIEGHAEMLSGLISTYDKRHVERVKNETLSYRDKINLRPIKCRTIASLASEYQIKKVDFLSVDTEGSELNVIKGIDLSQLEISLICLECNYGVGEVAVFMKSRGYEFTEKIAGDAFFRKSA